MTRLAQQAVHCPCGCDFSIIYTASICTWMDSSSLKKLIDGTGFSRKCPNCGKIYTINTDVLINSLSGMFTISSGASPDEDKEILAQHGLIDSKGEIVDDMIERLKREIKSRPSNFWNHPPSHAPRPPANLDSSINASPGPPPPPPPRLATPGDEVMDELNHIFGNKIKKDEPEEENKDKNQK
nr:CpXC domain-containing protein [Candidatus Sigynarchaeota archaeon]